MAFSLQCAHCESITAIKCQFQSHGSFATVSTLKEFLQRIFSIFAPCIMSSPSSLKRNMIKNKSKKTSSPFCASGRKKQRAASTRKFRDKRKKKRTSRHEPRLVNFLTEILGGQKYKATLNDGLDKHSMRSNTVLTVGMPRTTSD